MAETEASVFVPEDWISDGVPSGHGQENSAFVTGEWKGQHYMRIIKGGLVFLKSSSYHVIKNTPWKEVSRRSLNITESSGREQKYLLVWFAWALRFTTDWQSNQIQWPHTQKFFLLLKLLCYSKLEFYPRVDRVLGILFCFEKIILHFSAHKKIGVWFWMRWAIQKYTKKWKCITITQSGDYGFNFLKKKMWSYLFLIVQCSSVWAKSAVFR